MKKIHINNDQLDGHKYAQCGRTTIQHLIYQPDRFEATDPRYRCRVCEKYWFPFGQPEWHRAAALERYLKLETA